MPAVSSAAAATRQTRWTAAQLAWFAPWQKDGSQPEALILGAMGGEIPSSSRPLLSVPGSLYNEVKLL
jgi:hypothetical protein